MRKIVPEFQLPKEGESRAGFVPSDGNDEVELWQLWCRSAETDESRRATLADLKRAGFVRSKSVREKKAANKSARWKQ